MLSRLVRTGFSLSSSARCLSSSIALSSEAATQPKSVSKEALMKLRKRTGYSFVNCRKALVEFGPERLEEAEKWLRELAKKEGWAKAAKLSSRATSQGLVGVATNSSIAAVVELSCETDFVSRSDTFKKLMSDVATAVLAHASNVTSEADSKIVRQSFDVETLKTVEGISLRELITMAVGELKENINVKKIEVHFAPKDARLYAAAHPAEGTPELPMGKFVSVVAIKRTEKEGIFPTERLAAQLCQHIIGMRSETLGSAPAPKSETPVVEEKKVENSGKDELNDFEQAKTTEIDENETALLRQSFMLNPSQTVFDYATGHSAEIVDFVRSELTGQSE